jgi:hypothetical protein
MTHKPIRCKASQPCSIYHLKSTRRDNWKFSRLQPLRTLNGSKPLAEDYAHEESTLTRTTRMALIGRLKPAMLILAVMLTSRGHTSVEFLTTREHELRSSQQHARHNGTAVAAAKSSFPLDGPWRLRRDIVHHPVDAAHAVADAGRHVLQELRLERKPACWTLCAESHVGSNPLPCVAAFLVRTDDFPKGHQDPMAVPAPAAHACCSTAVTRSLARLQQEIKRAAGHSGIWGTPVCRHAV